MSRGEIAASCSAASLDAAAAAAATAARQGAMLSALAARLTTRSAYTVAVYLRSPTSTSASSAMKGNSGEKAAKKALAVAGPTPLRDVRASRAATTAALAAGRRFGSVSSARVTREAASNAAVVASTTSAWSAASAKPCSRGRNLPRISFHRTSVDSSGCVACGGCRAAIAAGRLSRTALSSASRSAFFPVLDASRTARRAEPY
mmetsp:Transcript_19481/g.74733  ORF Transcript_19481/g.74733 Transcript_19481/m.74733 type:complete len:204 (-) Transcript_19481:126-737(-)